MISFLKSFFAGEQSVEAQAVIVASQKSRDVLKLEGYAMDEEEEQQPRGCGGCGCGNGGCG